MIPSLGTKLRFSTLKHDLVGLRRWMISAKGARGLPRTRQVYVDSNPVLDLNLRLVRMIASPAARNFPYDMATETTIAVLRA